MQNVIREEPYGHTYAEPLSGLRVSWGAILAGAVAALAVSLILWALAAAIVFTAAAPTWASFKGSLVTLWICAMVTALIGAFVGGAIAGYLPGNARTPIALAHAFLAWALAFLVSGAVEFGMVGSIVRGTANALVETTGAVTQTAGSTLGGVAGGQMNFDVKARNLLTSLGYTPAEADRMVRDAQADLQTTLRRATPATPNFRSAGDTLLDWTAGLSWSWFGTWAVAAGLALAGGAISSKRLSRGTPRGVAAPPPPERVEHARPFTASPSMP